MGSGGKNQGKNLNVRQNREELGRIREKKVNNRKIIQHFLNQLGKNEIQNEKNQYVAPLFLPCFWQGCIYPGGASGQNIYR